MKKHCYNIIINTRFFLQSFLVITFIAMASATAAAFAPGKYTRTSKLASGTWVKIAIPEDGMYQITYDELQGMGFNNPRNVTVYGTGGHPISEVLDGTATDDLVAIPAKHYGNKIYFYACGPTQYRISTNAPTRFTRDFNSYSQFGYYFLTENDSPATEPQNITYGITGSNVRNTSLDYWHHEIEQLSASMSGKDMIGEIIGTDGLTLQYAIPNLCGDSIIVLNPCVATKCSEMCYITSSLNSQAASFASTSARIIGSTSEYVFYNWASPSAVIKPQDGAPHPANGTIHIGLNIPNGAPRWTRLDYCILTFHHYNSLQHAQDNQLRMGFENVSSADLIAINNPTSTTQLWNIDDPHNPKNYNIKSINSTMKGFTPLYTTPFTQFIAFDPAKQLKSISSFEHIENQNIHGLEVPHMVIVTCQELLPQAERIAQMHRDNDNMTVHVLDQSKIFNEFSSGTPDAMAIRLMNKMFYDRDNGMTRKFKHLLMMGAGNYDNRQLLAKRECTILTYESTTSNDENNSYVSDDFFGMLEDNSGKNPASDMLLLGVGRIPSASIQEAESDVDKLLNYVNNPDYGPWRNNALFIADYYNGDSEPYLHAFQVEGIGNIINDELQAGFMKNKVYVKQFPLDPKSEFCYEGRRSMDSQLKQGQYFATYVGHANPITITKEANLWTTNEAKNATNQHLPIMTTACCDVARFDGSPRGLMEIMFHNPKGGAIAMMAATRAAYANGNDALNQAFVRAFFCYNTKGYMPTLGEAYMLCKQSFGNVTNYNKMMFSLLGDPAMKINYPKPLFKIAKINGKTVGTSSIVTPAMQQVTVQANVIKPGTTSVDASFNGNATLTIYDQQKREVTHNGRDIYFPRQMLAQVNGRVVNGVFNGKAMIPRHTINPGSYGMISVYAHRDNSDEMVNGSFDKILLNAYNESSSLTIHDNTPPVIDAIYFNNEEDFELSTIVPPSSTLCIRATDDYAFNNQSMSFGNSMELRIDGGKSSVPSIKTFASIGDDGKQLTVDMPITLSPGDHTLQYTVYDAAGNMTSRNLSFTVANSQPITLAVQQEPATTVATFFIDDNPTIIEAPEINIKVFDHVGNLKWQGTTSKFPFDWNLIGTNGRKLPAGIYTFYGKYNDGINYGGTTRGTLVVADTPKK